MNRIDKKILHSEENNKKILSPYITAGDPEPGLTVELMHHLVHQGADILELGIPFSDPMAEGPTIQMAMERALKFDINCDDVLNMVIEFRKKDMDTPIVLMGYVNSIEQYGYEKFAKNAAKAGIDGTILVDMPPEESKSLVKIWDKYGLYPIFLCSPTTSRARIKLINKMGKGYLYFVSIKGVTGANILNLENIKNDYLHRKTQVDLPLFIGFGIKTPETAKSITQFADGIIVGAALIEEIINAYQNDKTNIYSKLTLLYRMRKAIDYKNQVTK